MCPVTNDVIIVIETSKGRKNKPFKKDQRRNEKSMPTYEAI